MCLPSYTIASFFVSLPSVFKCIPWENDLSVIFPAFSQADREQVFDHADRGLHYLRVLSTETLYACAARQSFVPALDICMSYIKLKS